VPEAISDAGIGMLIAQQACGMITDPEHGHFHLGL